MSKGILDRFQDSNRLRIRYYLSQKTHQFEKASPLSIRYEDSAARAFLHYNTQVRSVVQQKVKSMERDVTTWITMQSRSHSSLRVQLSTTKSSALSSNQ